jgi:hypothetical protein
MQIGKRQAQFLGQIEVSALNAPDSPAPPPRMVHRGAAHENLGYIAQFLKRFGKDHAGALHLGAHQLVARHGAGMGRGAFARRAGLAGMQQHDGLARQRARRRREKRAARGTARRSWQ